MDKFKTKNGFSVKAYQGDAMTLLAFDLTPDKKDNLAGFTIMYQVENADNPVSDWIYNRMTFPPEFYSKNTDIPLKGRNSTLYSPIQKFNWLHVPETDLDSQKPVFGKYTYQVTPRYIVNGILLPLNSKLTVKLNIDVKPFETKHTKVGFTRGFVSSVAYAKRFDVSNNHVRPPEKDDSLLFDTGKIAGRAKRWNDQLKKYEWKEYTFDEQHKWLGWQARNRIIEFIDETLGNPGLSLKVFAYDLDEPVICTKLLQLAASGRLKIILDNDGTHGKTDAEETDFENRFRQVAPADHIYRGNYLGLAHSKVLIQLKNNVAVKVLTGSTNFSTNGLYINSNHVLVFENKNLTELYNKVFDASFGDELMNRFKGSEFSKTDFQIDNGENSELTITFAPHPKVDAQRIFDRIKNRILEPGNTDILFAIMNDTSKSSILDAVKQNVMNPNIFTYGITDTVGKNDDYSVFLYKPNAINGIRVAAKGIQNTLPQPFGKVPGIDGYAIHHKFIVVNFKGENPVLYCGSSNLAFSPEQKNGDNLLEIRDKDIVTAFAIEALRLVDHFHWRNKELSVAVFYLDTIADTATSWYTGWYNPNDLKFKQRMLYIR